MAFFGSFFVPTLYSTAARPGAAGADRVREMPRAGQPADRAGPTTRAGLQDAGPNPASGAGRKGPGAGAAS